MNGHAEVLLSSNKLEHFVQILLALQERPQGVQVAELKKMLDITDRTYRNYRADLLQINSLQDEHGPRIIEDKGYLKIRPRVQAEQDVAQQVALFWATQQLAVLRAVAQEGPLTAARDDLLALLVQCGASVEDRARLCELTERADRMFILSPDAPKRYDAAAQGRILTLSNAMIQRQRIRMTYQSASSEREVNGKFTPLSLVLYRDALYLMASRELRVTRPDQVFTYAVDRISALTALATEVFEYPSQACYDPRAARDGAHFGIFQRHSAAAPIRVVLEFAPVPELVVFLRERTWYTHQQLEALPDGGLRMVFTVKDMDQVWPWIRSFGDDVRLIEPPGPLPRTMAAQREWAAQHTKEHKR
jgi:predicted DNA-binding transcriptional regulator YafY